MKEYIEYLSSLSAKQLILTLAKRKLADTAPIAIVGVGCRFPGDVNNLEVLWDSLMSGEVHTGQYPNGPPGVGGKPRWCPGNHGHSAALTKGAYLNNLEQSTNPLRLDIEELLYMDPQHRLLMDCVLDALTHAGLAADSLRGKRVGVFIGISAAEYLYAALNNGLDDNKLSPYMGTGVALSAAPARIAMLLGGEGPALAIDTACSSAVSALHQAKIALRNGECDWAVVGASHLLLSPFTTTVFDKAGMLSEQGVARIFDQRADGHVRGEGAGVILLATKEAMLESSLAPLAWVRGTAIHQQGLRPAISISTGSSQQLVIKHALQDAQLNAEDIHYVEANASGSKLGTQIEIENLRDAYHREAPLYVGSSKANFGHLESASGMLSLLKVVAIMKYGYIPAQINLVNLADDIKNNKGHIEFTTENRALASEETLYCGVSSFGFTGTNSHVILASGDVNAGNVQAREECDKFNAWPENNIWS